MKEAICEALFYTFGDTFKDYFDIRIDSQRGNVSPAEVQSILSIYGSGLMSKETAIKKLNPNMTMKEIQDELANIDFDQQLAQAQNPSPELSNPSTQDKGELDE
ncbi:hypothetical protein IKS57_00295 [bacterium]|nr:hypothetical protein [bacterium]